MIWRTKILFVFNYKLTMIFFLVKILIKLGYYNAGKLNVYTCLNIIQIKKVNKLIVGWSLEKIFLMGLKIIDAFYLKQ